MRGIALGGFMGTGKTVVGQALARALQCSFRDLDAVLEAVHGPIAEQFRDVGEAGFRQRERAMLVTMLKDPTGVLATGGGAWVDPKNRQDLAAVMDRVVLTAPLAVLAARVAVDGSRPLWDAEVEDRYRARAAAYRDADLVVDTNGLTVSEVVARILSWRQSQGR